MQRMEGNWELAEWGSEIVVEKRTPVWQWRAISEEEGAATKKRKRDPVEDSTISFKQQQQQQQGEAEDTEAIQQMKEMIYRAAAFRPVNLGVEAVERPRRKNVRISTDPQTVAARQRRERISERLRVLQKLVPGGSKMDTASMLDEAANYLKFLTSQVKALQANPLHPPPPITFNFSHSYPQYANTSST